MRVSGLCLECYIRYSLVLGDNFSLHNQPPVETLDAVIVAWSMLIFKKKLVMQMNSIQVLGIRYLHYPHRYVYLFT